MSMHYRKTIRDRVVDLLKTGLPVLGTDPQQYMALDVNQRVFPSRPDPIFDSEYPLALVYFQSENVREMTTARDVIYRVLELNVDLVHMVRDDIDDELDRLAWQTEVILLADHTMALDQVNWIELRTSLPYQQDVDGEQRRAVTRLTFAVDFWTEMHMPGTLNEFLSFGKDIIAQIGDGAESEIDQTIRES
jgi:hypothetical protein